MRWGYRRVWGLVSTRRHFWPERSLITLLALHNTRYHPPLRNSHCQYSCQFVRRGNCERESWQHWKRGGLITQSWLRLRLLKQTKSTQTCFQFSATAEIRWFWQRASNKCHMQLEYSMSKWWVTETLDIDAKLQMLQMLVSITIHCTTKLNKNHIKNTASHSVLISSGRTF